MSFQDAIKEVMDQIEVSICMSMSGMSFQPTPTNEKTQSQRQYVQQEHHQTSYHHSKNSEAMVVPSKTAYLSSASTTPTDLMDVVSSAACVGAY